MVPLRGTRLYVEVSGSRNAPALVYFHGGPGVGSYEFAHYCGSQLAQDWRLVVFDQRGVLRSSPLRPGEAYGMDDLVADADELRQHLGIKKWSVLGHSFGGHYALRYALAHGQQVERLILENPAYSFPESTRSNLQAVARLYRKLGKPQRADEAEELASKQLPARELLAATIKVMGDLGEDRQALYLYDQRWRGYFGRLAAVSGLNDGQWQQGQRQAEKLFEDGKIFEPMLDRIAEWRGPLLLIKGETDHAASPEEVAAVERLSAGRVIQIPRSGHFCHVEQPQLFAEAVATSLQGPRMKPAKT